MQVIGPVQAFSFTTGKSPKFSHQVDVCGLLLPPPPAFTWKDGCTCFCLIFCFSCAYLGMYSCCCANTTSEPMHFPFSPCARWVPGYDTPFQPTPQPSRTSNDDLIQPGLHTQPVLASLYAGPSQTNTRRWIGVEAPRHVCHYAPKGHKRRLDVNISFFFLVSPLCLSWNTRASYCHRHISTPYLRGATCIMIMPC